MQVAAIILAAGSSTRFGSPKQVARIGERTMFECVVDVARRTNLRPILAVVPPGLAVPADVVPVVNGEPAAGISRSLRMGLAAVPAEVGVALILLGDQPTMTVDAVRAVVDAELGGRSVAAATANGRIAPPVLLTRAAFGLATDLAGDHGLAPALAALDRDVVRVEVSVHPPDVDTPDDLRSLR